MALGLAWSKCVKNEECDGDRNRCMREDCKARGYKWTLEGPGNFEDCGDWRFRIRCVNPDWKHSGDFNGWKDDGCTDLGVRRYARQVEAHSFSWEESAQFLMDTIGSEFYGKRVLDKRMEKNTAMWVVVFVEDKSAQCTPGWLNSGPADGWKDDGCVRPGVRRWARKVDAKNFDWDKSADFLLGTIGSEFYGKQVVGKEKTRNDGIWVWVFTKDDTNCQPTFMKSGDVDEGWKDDGCKRIKQRRYARQVDAKNFDWNQSADYLLNNKMPTTIGGKPLVDKDKNQGFLGLEGMWVRGYVEDLTCNPKWENEKSICDTKNKEMRYVQCKNWVDDDPMSCKLASNRPQGVIGWIPCGLGSDPTSVFCSPLSSNAEEFNCLKGQECYAVVKYTDSFDCDKERREDAINRRDKTFKIEETTKCFEDNQGEYGETHQSLLTPITTETEFTLEAINWITGQEGAKTFLKNDGGSIQTDDSVKVTASNLPDVYKFKFEKVGCQTDQHILYGNHVQLKAVATNSFIQCGGGTDALHGTCSAVKDSGTCKYAEWQTFFIESPEGKTGRVCFGDNVYIRQTTGRKEAITAAGGKNVWSCTPGSEKNNNNILKIQGLNGSIYKDPKKEMEAYELTRCAELCSRDPANSKCSTFGDCGGFQQFLKNNKIAIILVLVLCILSSVGSGLKAILF